MPTTTHERVFTDYARGATLDEARGLVDTWDGTPIVGQPHRWDDAQLAALAWVNARMHSGHVGMFRLLVREAPAPDAERTRNAAAVERAMSEPFSAAVEPGVHGPGGQRERQSPGLGDGYLRWDAAVRATVWRGEAIGEVTLPPNEVPLEIGATLASRTALHLIEDGAVARWPYGDDCIHVLVLRDIARNAMAKRVHVDY